MTTLSPLPRLRGLGSVTSVLPFETTVLRAVRVDFPKPEGVLRGVCLTETRLSSPEYSRKKTRSDGPLPLTNRHTPYVAPLL